MRDVDGGGLEPILKATDLDAHLSPETGVQIGEGLVEEKHLRLTHHGASHRDPLPLSSGQRFRLAIEQGLEAEHAGRPRNAAFDLVAGNLSEAKSERQVVAHGHVRVQPVVLEHHRDVAVTRSQVCHIAVVDADPTRGNGLQAGEHPQDRRLPGSRSADQHEQLAVRYL